MKKILIFTAAITIVANIFAQTEVNKTVVEIPKEFKKSKIALAELTNDNQLEVILSKEEKKETQLFRFTFDQKVNKIDGKDIQMENSGTSSGQSSRNAISNPVSIGAKDGIIRFVRVTPSSFWGEMELEKGYMQKNYIDGQYVGQEFVTEKKITNIRTSDDRKIIPISEMHVGIGEQAQTTKTFGLSGNFGYLAAGDLIAVGGVFPKLLTKGRLGVGSSDTYIDYCIVKADAKKLDVDKITLIPFKYVQQTELCKEVKDKKLMLITRDFPLAYKGSEEFYNKGSNTRTITLINKEGIVDKQISFEGTPDMLIVGADMAENGNLYILARAGKKKEMGIVAIKIENDKVVYTQNTPLSEMENIVVKPSNEKKARLISDNFDKLSNKTNKFRGLFELENKNFIAVFQDMDLPGCLFYLQFDEKGKLIKQYTNTTKEDLTASADGKVMRPIDFFIRQNNNSGFYSVIIEKTKKGNYFSVCKIDGNAGTMSNFTLYGRETDKDKNEYYLDKMNPAIDTPDGGLIMISRTDDNKFLCVEKIKFE